MAHCCGSNVELFNQSKKLSSSALRLGRRVLLGVPQGRSCGIFHTGFNVAGACANQPQPQNLRFVAGLYARRMTNSIVGLLFALISFIVTFVIARAIAKWLKRRRARKDEEEAAKNESRQVRRARERGKGPR